MTFRRLPWASSYLEEADKSYISPWSVSAEVVGDMYLTFYT